MTEQGQPLILLIDRQDLGRPQDDALWKKISGVLEQLERAKFFGKVQFTINFQGGETTSYSLDQMIQTVR